MLRHAPLVLALEVEIGGITVKDVDMIRWSSAVHITEFKVMLRRRRRCIRSTRSSAPRWWRTRVRRALKLDALIQQALHQRVLHFASRADGEEVFLHTFAGCEPGEPVALGQFVAHQF